MNIPTTTLPLNALTPHPENYNSHPASQIKELAESLSTFGQFKNIVTWTCPENMTTPEGHELHEGLTYILAGHGLWLAAMEAGVDELEVKDYSGISYEMAIGLLLVDNAAPLGSVPIVTALASLLERAREPMADKPRLGAMLERLRERAGINGHQRTEEAGPPRIDKAAELQKVWGVKVGDVWELGRHRLVCGDCTDRATVEAVMRGERAEACITDPPFNVRDDGWDKFNDFIGFTQKWFSLAKNQADIIASFFPDKFLPLLAKVAEMEGFPFRRSLIWVKPPGSQFAGGNKDGYWFDFELIQVYGDLKFTPEPPIRFSVFDYRTITGQQHGAEKPVGVYADIIAGYTQYGKLVYEPFSGTGSNLVACEELGRHCRGIELDPSYVAVTLERMSNLGLHPHRLT